MSKKQTGYSIRHFKICCKTYFSKFIIGFQRINKVVKKILTDINKFLRIAEKGNDFWLFSQWLYKKFKTTFSLLNHYFTDLAKRNYHEGVTAINSDLFCFSNTR
jgi:hypothetical protein